MNSAFSPWCLIALVVCGDESLEESEKGEGLDGGGSLEGWAPQTLKGCACHVRGSGLGCGGMGGMFLGWR